MDRVKVLAKAIAQTEALQLGYFTNDMGEPAPLHFDLNKLWQDPTMLAAATKELCTVIKDEFGQNYNRIGGSDHSGLPIATLASQFLDKPLVVLRRTPSEDKYGPVLGTMFSGDKIVVVDDVIATGKKALEIAKLVKNEGGVLHGYCVLLDKQEGGTKLLEEKHVHFACVATLMEVADELHRFGWLEDSTFSSISDYVTSHVH
ncbi:MAG TPA: phosphoribosyltransferase family protein [Thermoproteota archaeon]|nr:phosphoribosyltransferase family protein [Thermoproteota archaeon]